MPWPEFSISVCCVLFCFVNLSFFCCRSCVHICMCIIHLLKHVMGETASIGLPVFSIPGVC